MRRALIESGRSRGLLALTITDDGPSYDAGWKVRLETPSVTATHGFWTVVEPEELVQFFDDLAANWHGWEGRRVWKSVEHDLSVVATHDELGHVVLRVTLGTVLAPDQETWLVRAPLEFDADNWARSQPPPNVFW